MLSSRQLSNHPLSSQLVQHSLAHMTCLCRRTDLSVRNLCRMSCIQMVQHSLVHMVKQYHTMSNPLEHSLLNHNRCRHMCLRNL